MPHLQQLPEISFTLNSSFKTLAKVTPPGKEGERGQEFPKAFNTARGRPDQTGGNKGDQGIPAPSASPGLADCHLKILAQCACSSCSAPPPAFRGAASQQIRHAHIFCTRMSRCCSDAVLEIARHLSVTRHGKHPSMRAKQAPLRGRGRGSPN